MTARIIYYQNLDYDQLPTARKRPRMMPSAADSIQQVMSKTTPTKKAPAIQQLSRPMRSPSLTRPTTFSKPLSQIQTTPVITYASAYNNNNNNNDNDFLPSKSFRSNTPSSSSSLSQATTQILTQSPKTFVPPSQDQLRSALENYFGFSSFRGNQKQAIEATCKGLDTLILMPTGGGKSICYQLPAILTEGLTVVVSPLKSLISDQVTRLREREIKTSALFGETCETEAADIYQDLKSPQPKHKLLYVTPEKINCNAGLINLFRDLHRRQLLARFVIDEAHCVSMWGSDFRPDYRKLGKLRDLFYDVPIMALTATAPPKVREDILVQLKMDQTNGKTFIQSFNRPNLKFEVRVKSKGCVDDIAKFIGKQFKDQCGIIYCLSRKECEQIAEKLRERAISSAPYHAGLSDKQRKKIFQAWSHGVFKVVCATIAFGMGIDKSNVRYVIHYSVPKSIEGYYQEAGRAGRDGDFAACVLYYSKSDLYRMKSMLSKGFGRKAEDKERDKVNLDSIIAYVDNKTECRRSILLHYLGEKFDRKNCISHIKTACDNCLAAQNRMKHCDSYEDVYCDNDY